MRKNSIIFIPALALIAVLSIAGKLESPILTGFPWPDPADRIVLEVPSAPEGLRLDGQLNDDAWAGAAMIDKFYRAADAGLAPFDGRVKVLYDGSNLVLGLDLPRAEADSNPGKCFLTGEYNVAGEKNNVSIQLDPTHGHGVYYQLVTDPAGRREDLRVMDESWSACWSVAVGKTGNRWQAEILIPVSEIICAPQPGDVWGFNIVLNRADGESTLSSTPIRLDLVDSERFGHILFKGNLAQDRLQEIKSSLPRLHLEAKEARLAENSKICGPEFTGMPGELKELSQGEEVRLKSGLKVTCLGIDNPPVVRSRHPFFYEKYENPDLQRLRKIYRLDEIVAPGKNEFEKMLLLNEWLVNHVPFGSPPPIRPQAFHVLDYGLAGQTFNCTYLSFTLVQLYSALGWTARKITSQGHGTLDVWSNYWSKWIQIDPSHNSYFRLKGNPMPLNSNEIRREFWRNQGVDMEMVYGAEQRAEKVTLELRDTDGLLKYRQDGYAWIAYKTRNNFFDIPYAYRNFLYLVIEDEYNRGKKWEDMYTGQIDERYLFSIVTDRVGDIFWTLNQAGIHLYDQGERALKVELETVTPNFQRFEIATDDGKWRETGSVFVWELHQGQNTLRARSVNKWDLPGGEHKVVLAVNE